MDSSDDDRLVILTLLIDIVTNLLADRTDPRHQLLPKEYIDEFFGRSPSAIASLQSMGFTRRENNAFVFDPKTSIEQLNNVLHRLEGQRDPVSIPSSFSQLIPFVSTLKQVKTYEEKKLLQYIREEILPRQRFAVDQDKDLQLIELLKWFKEDFFTWFNQADCQRCRIPMTPKGSTSPTRQELEEGDAHRVELYRCSRCSAEERFPRFNNVWMLLKTRRGRCGEAANLFTCLCRALDMESRYIHDPSDHVWTEVYSENLQRWIHCDACENTCDSPLMYEQGWKKQLSFCVAFARDHLEDVTWRYVTDFPQTIRRRNINEKHFQRVIQKINGTMQRQLESQRRKELVSRRLTDLVEMLTEKKPTKETEMNGRQSGSMAWRLARSETEPTKEITPGFSYSISTSDCERGQFSVEYNSVSDEYSPGGVGWSSRLHSYSNIQRKVERDWKMVYLCREKLHSPGRLTWHFQLDSDCRLTHRISQLTIQCPMKKFDEHSQTKCSMKFSNGTSVDINDGVSQRVDDEEIFVEVSMNSSNDLNDLNAWQKSQFCRQSLQPSDEDRSHLFLIEFKLEKIN